jgi:hypothetical protein
MCICIPPKIYSQKICIQESVIILYNHKSCEKLHKMLEKLVFSGVVFVLLGRPVCLIIVRNNVQGVG